MCWGVAGESANQRCNGTPCELANPACRAVTKHPRLPQQPAPTQPSPPSGPTCAPESMKALMGNPLISIFTYLLCKGRGERWVGKNKAGQLKINKKKSSRSRGVLRRVQGRPPSGGGQVPESWACGGRWRAATCRWAHISHTCQWGHTLEQAHTNAPLLAHSQHSSTARHAAATFIQPFHSRDPLPLNCRHEPHTSRLMTHPQPQPTAHTPKPTKHNLNRLGPLTACTLRQRPLGCIPKHSRNSQTRSSALSPPACGADRQHMGRVSKGGQ